MRLYSLGETCALLTVDAVTLRRWMRRINVIPHVDPSDRRRRYLDQVQLGQLAEAHNRVLLVPSDAVGERLAKIEGNVALLAQRLERLEQLSRSLCASVLLPTKAAER